MNVLHLVKTSDGASWATLMAAELVQRGVKVHVALPSPHGRQIAAWRATNATLHFVSVDLPVRAPWRWPRVRRSLRQLVADIQPDLIHSHFVGTTLALRLALGRQHSIPRLFQVPGPLHLEHRFYRQWELSTAGPSDYWIASSRYIQRLYCEQQVPPERLFLSYYGARPETFSSKRTGLLRRQLGFDDSALVVGNANFMYPPKLYLGQLVGLKRHEAIIQALAIAARQEPRLQGVLVGKSWNNSQWYERKLRRQAAAASDRIHLPGCVPSGMVGQILADFDLIVHAPLSENCGGVHEALMAEVPVVSNTVGGLPEVIIDGVTGATVTDSSPPSLANAILAALEELPKRRAWARTGRRLLQTMFNVRRTAGEIWEIYRHVLSPEFARPQEFDSRKYVQTYASQGAAFPTESAA